MPYVVIADEVTVHKVVGTQETLGGEVFYDTVGQVVSKGTVLEDDDVTPPVRQAVEDEDPYTSSKLKYVDEKGAKDFRSMQFADDPVAAFFQSNRPSGLDSNTPGMSTTTPPIGEGPEVGMELDTEDPTIPGNVSPTGPTGAEQGLDPEGDGGDVTADEVVQKNVTDVKAFMDANPELVDEVKQAEREQRGSDARTTVLDYEPDS